MEYQISENAEANRLINRVVSDLKTFSDTLISEVEKLTSIGTSLSSESHIPRLLEMIVDIARELTRADGGTLYIVSDDEKYLGFEIAQNTSLKVRMGGTSAKITWDQVRLTDDNGQENHTNVSAHVALTGKQVNIQDVYHAAGFDFTGTKEFDHKTGYRSQSMLVVPLRNHEQEIIGVLQLLNAKSALDGAIIPFSPEAEAMALSLSSLAAVALTKNRLIQDLENLFESFIRTIARAIDEKSPYTGGHIRRVAEISMMIAQNINETKEGPYADITFTDDELKELRIAAWMHDIGKITTPEYVVDKSTKLETIHDRIGEVKARFEIFNRDAEIRFLKKKISCMETKESERITQYEEEYNREREQLSDDIAFITTVNTGGEFLPPEKITRIEEIGGKTREGMEGLTWLTKDEVYNLSISKGTLNKEERERIQDHVRLTEEMLNQLTFPKKLKHVAEYACAHHETLDGTGYHKGLKGDEIPLQARILAIADIFEALSASDRPYKKGKTASEVVKILGFMVKDNHIDKELYDLFITKKLFHNYIRAEYKPDQIDITLQDVEQDAAPPA